MSQLPFLNELQYQHVLRSALGKQGISDQVADVLIMSRWPMFLPSALAECDSRGITLSAADVDEFVWEVFDGPPPNGPDGQIIEAEKLLFTPEIVGQLLEWSSSNGRGRASATSEAIANLLERKAEGVK